METILFITIFSAFSSIKGALNLISADNFERVIKSVSHTKDYYDDIIKNITKIFDYYAFIDVAKAPPQPFFDSGYFPKVDIIRELGQIKTDEQNDYEFKRALKLSISKLRDLHVSLDFTTMFDYFFLFFPIKLQTKHTNSNAKMYGKLYLNDVIFLALFGNNKESLDIIKRDGDIAISSINNMTPSDFIENFGGEIAKLHNPHASFTNKLIDEDGTYLEQYPLSVDELRSFNVTYENGDFFSTNIAICYTTSDATQMISSLRPKTTVSFFESEEIEKKLTKFLDEKTKKKARNSSKNFQFFSGTRKRRKSIRKFVEEFEAVEQLELGVGVDTQH